ncbi:MAG: 16S rRNA (cytosine(1402)-N(4))-methyltransferase RsmH [Sedimentisphaerales bacterium]|nr:16S rRNA (cytosine(1402)-N(4))-methyltransferase RsmH [Sedimentisphaerales bacterium]
MDSPAAHQAVLFDAVMQQLDYRPDAVVVDATLGHAGHGRALAERLNADGLLLGLDVDENCLAVARHRLDNTTCQVKLIQENFGSLSGVLDQLGLEAVDVILADLGVNSAQLAESSYGISFQQDGPLDMRLDRRLQSTAADLVNGLRQDDLADIIYKYGEERRSRAIARAIVERRREKRFCNTGELVTVIFKALGLKGSGGRSKIHPATRTFQALRIAVNDELGQLERLLDAAAQRLKIGGQVAIISFHSLEDRIVKYDFRARKEAGIYEIMTKKPLVAAEDERKQNPRSRSAKLRVARKIGN